MAAVADKCDGASPIPAVAGIGLKPQHFEDILGQRAAAGWFEVHPENYFVPGGPLHHYLGRIRERYPLSLHSVGMSIGSVDGVDETHIRRIGELCRRYQPALVSDHLSWSRWQHYAINDLLPMPYTAEALALMCDNVDRIQNLLGRRIAIENPSSYLQLPHGDMDECDFLITLARRSGATILLDVNNVFVSAGNHGFAPESYIERIPAALVSELHLAGHSIERLPHGELRIDDHGSRVCDAVWALYELTLQCLGPVPTLIEWDTGIPEFSVLQDEAARADAGLRAVPAGARRHG